MRRLATISATILPGLASTGIAAAQNYPPRPAMIVPFPAGGAIDTLAPSTQQSPEALRAYQKAEAERWWSIIKASNIKVD